MYTRTVALPVRGMRPLSIATTSTSITLTFSRSNSTFENISPDVEFIENSSKLVAFSKMKYSKLAFVPISESVALTLVTKVPLGKFSGRLTLYIDSENIGI